MKEFADENYDVSQYIEKELMNVKEEDLNTYITGVINTSKNLIESDLKEKLKKTQRGIVDTYDEVAELKSLYNLIINDVEQLNIDLECSILSIKADIDLSLQWPLNSTKDIYDLLTNVDDIPRINSYETGKRNNIVIGHIYSRRYSEALKEYKSIISDSISTKTKVKTAVENASMTETAAMQSPKSLDMILDTIHRRNTFLLHGLLVESLYNELLIPINDDSRIILILSLLRTIENPKVILHRYLILCEDDISNKHELLWMGQESPDKVRTILRYIADQINKIYHCISMGLLVDSDMEFIRVEFIIWVSELVKKNQRKFFNGLLRMATRDVATQINIISSGLVDLKDLYESIGKIGIDLRHVLQSQEFVKNIEKHVLAFGIDFQKEIEDLWMDKSLKESLSSHDLNVTLSHFVRKLKDYEKEIYNLLKETTSITGSVGIIMAIDTFSRRLLNVFYQESADNIKNVLPVFSCIKSLIKSVIPDRIRSIPGSATSVIEEFKKLTVRLEILYKAIVEEFFKKKSEKLCKILEHSTMVSLKAIDTSDSETNLWYSWITGIVDEFNYIQNLEKDDNLDIMEILVIYKENILAKLMSMIKMGNNNIDYIETLVMLSLSMDLTTTTVQSKGISILLESINDLVGKVFDKKDLDILHKTEKKLVNSMKKHLITATKGST